MDAIDDLGDAIDVTRDLLLPVRAGLWLKLAIVVLFVGGSMGLGGGGGVPTGDIDPALEETGVDAPAEELPEDVLLFVGVVLLVGLLLWLLLGLIGAIMEFVFLESLRSMEVRIRRFGKENLGRALQLFLFRIVAGILLALLIGGPIAVVLLSASSLEAAAGSLVLIGLLAIPVYFVYAITMRFTSEFVAPVMLLEKRGILSAWGRFWGTLTSNLAEYAVYLVLVWILQLVVNIAAGILLVFGALLVIIPFAIVAVLLTMLGDIGVLLAIFVVILGALAVILVYALIQMPIRTYFQYYALLLLGDTKPELDLIPEQRAAVRNGDDRGGAGGVGPGGPDDGTGPDAPDGRWGTTPDDEPLWETDDDTDDESETGSGWDRSSGWDTDIDRDSDRSEDAQDDENDEDSGDDGRGW
ncbi:DUF7544 domain-containing protein [Halobiforma nitratireducens]|uniref:Glycerophosphoryl diester phosphodiesterase membrane domain-containing protein n=1 Tax=Halobiforma nitratireducens JCM 10879 TaxID=1227454 RepID=M0M2Z3_9EURY|nr:hypothetical protein [Halobiforma nitratireducens]EMA40041.1 hypothetical protein C446_07719 [Halobiforma nitratireducens JCM 10879]